MSYPRQIPLCYILIAEGNPSAQRGAKLLLRPRRFVDDEHTVSDRRRRACSWRLFCRRQADEEPQSRAGLAVRSHKSGSQQGCFQFEEGGQKLVRFDDESASIAAVCVNDVMQSTCGCDSAVAPRPTGCSNLVSDDLPVFVHGSRKSPPCSCVSITVPDSSKTRITAGYERL